MTTDLNLPLIERVLNQITLDPASWDQTYWAAETTCGTTMCFAGWAIALSHPGAEFTDWDQVDNDPNVIRDASRVRLPGQDVAEEDVNISMYAQQLLGMTDDEAVSVFYTAKMPLDRLRGMIEKIVRDRGLTLTGRSDLDLAGGPR